MKAEGRRRKAERQTRSCQAFLLPSLASSFCLLPSRCRRMTVESQQPLVGIIMGSKSDWETMGTPRTCCRAGRPARGADRLGAPHAGLAVRVRPRGRGPRPRGDHRRGRRRRAPARHGWRLKTPAGARRAGREPGADRARLAAVDRPDAERACRWGRWPSARAGAVNAALLAVSILSNSRPELHSGCGNSAQTDAVLRDRLPGSPGTPDGGIVRT